MAPFVEALLDATEVGPGNAVLDVVCGTGFTAATEAARVTRKGGRVGATVWSPLERSPYFQALFRAVQKIIGAQASSLFDDARGAGDRLDGRTAGGRTAPDGSVTVPFASLLVTGRR